MLNAPMQGFMFGPIIAYIVLKALKPDDEEMYSILLNWLPTLVLMGAPMWGVGGRGSRWYWKFSAFAGRMIPACLLALATEPWHALVLIVMMYFFTSGVPPLQNSLFGRNYTAMERDRNHGRAKLMAIPIMIAAAVTLNVWLDSWDHAFRVMLPIGGVMAAFAFMQLGKVRMRRVDGDPIGSSVATQSRVNIDLRRVPMTIAGRFSDMARLFKRDREFAIYELSFMLYGTSFMMLMPVIPLLMKNRFEMNYTGFVLYTFVAFKGIVFLGHFYLRGRTGSWSAQKLTGMAFGILILYPTFLLIASVMGVKEISIVGFILYGSGMVLVEYAWNFGPLRFARGKDPMPYVSAHMMLVGVRGILSYPAAWLLLGYAKAHNGADPISQSILKAFLGDAFVPGEPYYFLSLLIPIGFMMAAAGTNVWLHLRVRKRGIHELMGKGK